MSIPRHKVLIKGGHCALHSSESLIYLYRKFLGLGRLKKYMYRKLIVLLVMLAVVIFFVVAKYRVALHGLEMYSKPIDSTVERIEYIYPKLDFHQSMQIGWAYNRGKLLFARPSNCYLNYPFKKKEGVVRVGVFGCSFVRGLETAKGFDFPSFLERDFKENGFENVEVLNFGVSGFGMHQAYMLWDFLGKHYELDYVVFCIFDFFSVRDNCFIERQDAFLNLHARYILDNKKLKLIDVKGQSIPDARRRYFSMTPPMRYVLYDYKMPFILRAILPESIKNRSNPFYYKHEIFRQKDAIDKEIAITHSLLFKEILRDNKNVIVVVNSAYKYKKYMPRNVHVYENNLIEDVNFTHLAPNGHWSALGNEIIGRCIFNILIGKGKFKTPVFSVGKLLKCAGTSAKLKLDELYNYKKVYLSVNKSQIARFFLLRDRGKTLGFDFKSNRAKSILCVSDFEPFSFLCLPFHLKNKEKLYLTFYVNSEKKKFVIGAIDLVNPFVGVMFLNAAKIASLDRVFRLGHGGELEHAFSLYISKGGKIKDVVIETNSGILLKGVFHTGSAKTSKYRMEGFHSEFFYLRSANGNFVKLSSLPKYGHIDLVMEDTSGNKTEIPFLKYSVKTLEYKFRKAYKNPISPSK